MSRTMQLHHKTAVLLKPSAVFNNYVRWAVTKYIFPFNSVTSVGLICHVPFRQQWCKKILPQKTRGCNLLQPTSSVRNSLSSRCILGIETFFNISVCKLFLGRWERRYKESKVKQMRGDSSLHVHCLHPANAPVLSSPQTELTRAPSQSVNKG